MNPASAEFSRLLSLLLDQELPEKERQRLEEILRVSEEARRAYLDLMEIDALLGVELAAPLAPVTVRRRRLPRPKRWVVTAVAASLLLGLVGTGTWYHYVGSVVAHVAVVGSSGRSEFPTAWIPGDRVRPGDSIELPNGLVQVEFKSGARVVLQGQGRLVIESTMRCRLVEGELATHVPETATGFVVETAAGTVRDMGTRFCLTGSQNGEVDVHVVEGRVEATPTNGASLRTGLVSVEELGAVRMVPGSQNAEKLTYSADAFSTSLSLLEEVTRSAGPLLFITDPPLSLDINRFENDQHAVLLMERQTVVLSEDLPVDLHRQNASSIPAGTRIDSYLVHFDAGEDVVYEQAGARGIDGSITFRRPVLGAITTSETLLETDPVVGLPEMDYPTQGTGLLRRSSHEPRDSVELVDRHTVRFRLTTMPDPPEACGMDQLRILLASADEAD